MWQKSTQTGFPFHFHSFQMVEAHEANALAGDLDHRKQPRGKAEYLALWEHISMHALQENEVLHNDVRKCLCFSEYPFL